LLDFCVGNSLFVSVSFAIISALIASILSVSIANALRVSVFIESGFLDVAWPRVIFQVNFNIFIGNLLIQEFISIDFIVSGLVLAVFISASPIGSEFIDASLVGCGRVNGGLLLAVVDPAISW